jgi:hypothetical protein
MGVRAEEKNMQMLVVYESMYGNTHEIADHIAEGLRLGGDVDVVAVAGATPERLAAADLLVVGGPTHIHGMTTNMSRKAAVEPDAVAKGSTEDHELHVDPDAEGPGLRDWFGEMKKLDRPVKAVAFDTRIGGGPSAAVTGRASKGITRRLKRHGFDVVAEPESFLVTTENELMEGEAYRATVWAADLLASIGAAPEQGAAKG